MSLILKGVQATRVLQVHLFSDLKVGLELFDKSFQVSEFLSLWLRQRWFKHLLVNALLFFLLDRLLDHLFLYRNNFSRDHHWGTRIKLLAACVALAYLMGLVDEL